MKRLSLSLIFTIILFALPVWAGPDIEGGSGGGTGTSFSVTDITGQTDDTTPATTATAVLAQGGSLIESTLGQIATAINPTAATLHIDDTLTALGIASEATNFGTFTGSTIADNQTAKVALQSLETAVETKAPASGIALTALANQAAQTVNANATDGAAAPTAVAISASQVVARLAAGNIKGASTAEMKTLLGYYTSGDSPTFAAAKFTTGAGANKLLTSDADGDATWTDTIAISTLNLPSTNADPGTTAGQIRHDSSDTQSQTTARGVVKWFDGTSVRTFADIGTDSTMITKTEFLPIRYAEDGTTPPSAAAAVTGKIIIARSFATTKDVVFFWVVPNDFVGAGVKFRVHYALSTDAAADDTVTFTTTGCIIANSADIACTAGTALAIADELGTSDDQYQYMVTDYSAESNADWGVAAGGLMKLGFSYTDDDYDFPALVIGIEIKYKAKLDGFASY